MVRRAGTRARPPPSPRRVPGRPPAPHDRRAARSLARGPRAGMDQLSDRAPALHRRRQVLDLVLARPQPPIPHLRPTPTIEPRRRSAQRDRPRPHLHLLGLTPKRPPADGSPPNSGGANSADGDCNLNGVTPETEETPVTD